MGPQKHRVEFLVSPDGSWIAMYLDGHLIEQGNDLPAPRALALLAGRMGFASSSQLLTQPMMNDGGCPQTLPLPRVKSSLTL
ncbi:hypothetical protein ANAEL_03705 [Anaerolineales bacterium]|nr:hypothetical protein ANAEL_03705 [Anaerolineales bacterium]